MKTTSENNQTPKNVGKVKFYDPVDKYGFIIDANGERLYFNDKSFAKGVFFLESGTEVEYDTVKTERGVKAVNVVDTENKDFYIDCDEDEIEDEREVIAQKLDSEFGIKLPFFSWASMTLEEVQSIYDDQKRKGRKNNRK